MRKKLIAGNWKMNGSKSQAQTLVDRIKQGASEYPSVDILVIPPFTYLSIIHEQIEKSRILLGAQDIYVGASGAFTGEISGPMLADVGCQYVLIGHSERRTLFHEDLKLLNAKFKSALDAGLTPILCVGETKEERQKEQTEQVIYDQLNAVIESQGIAAFSKAVIAYEPVWAIGTGLTASPEQAEEVHSFIRQHLAQNNVDIAKTIRILYGGSMKPENAEALLAMPDIDGGLIGGASLDALNFLAICAAAEDICHHEAG